MIRDDFSAVLLVIGLVIVLASCIGIAVMDDPLDRLHLVTPAAMLGSVALCAAVVLRDGMSATGTAAILVGVVVAGTSPFTSHAMARSIMVRRDAGPKGFDAAYREGSDPDSGGHRPGGGGQ